MNKDNTSHRKNQENKVIKSRSKKNHKSRLSFLKYIFILLASIIIVGTFFCFGIIKGILDSTPSVNVSSFSNFSVASTIYDREGNVMNNLIKEGSNRLIASKSEIPQHLKDAFVAIEDEGFYEHQGIDLHSVIRAIYGVLSSNQSLGGGSTITQQLVKNVVFNVGQNEKGFEKFIRKIQEMYISIIYENQGARALLNLNKTSNTNTLPYQSHIEIKDEIITNYLNIINLGANTLGVKVATKRYFNKELKDLTISEAAVLASITKNPSRYNPITHPEKNQERQQEVLRKMLKNNFITQKEYEEAINDPVYTRIKYNDVALIENKSSIYSYFTDAVVVQATEDLKNYFINTNQFANATELNKAVNDMLYSGGLKIYTTMDPKIQKIVDKHINDESNYSIKKYSIDYRLSVIHKNDTQTHYSQYDIDNYQKKVLKNTKYDGLFKSKDEANKYIQSFKNYILKNDDEILAESTNYVLQPQASFVIMDQKTGEVLALNGGRGEKTQSLTLNRATGTKRQPGSTFKVLTAFAPALEKFNKSLATVYYDSEYSYKDKVFKNWYSTGFLGFQNIRAGIVYSLNIIALRCLLETVSPEIGVDFARQLGITTLTKDDYNPAAALGGLTDGVTNLELTNAFATIANEGNFMKYKLYTKITDYDGNVLIDNTNNSPTRVLSKENAYLLTDAMRDSMIYNKVIASNNMNVTSTSTRSRFSGMSLAGKSGTTTNNKDVWFVGYSPYYTAGVWGGLDENQSLSTSTTNNGGTRFHKNIWRKIMAELHANKKDIGFTKPNNIVEKTICRKSGLLATDGCKNDPRGNMSYKEYFSDGTQPKTYCKFHNANGTVNIPEKYIDLTTDDTLYQDFTNMVVPNITPNIPTETETTQYNFTNIVVVPH